MKNFVWLLMTTLAFLLNAAPAPAQEGQRVAVCDQLEDPKLAKGIGKRGVMCKLRDIWAMSLDIRR